MRVIVIDGTPEEIAKAFPSLNLDQSNDTETNETKVLVRSSPDDERRETPDFVSTIIARRILKRRELSGEMRTVLKTIMRAFPRSVAATELQKRIGYKPSQFAGLMGAFGRRVAYTSGYEDGSMFFIQTWDHDAGCYMYAIPESVREAIKLENI